MRLTPAEQQAISDAAREAFAHGTRVLLFGSRVDDAGKGGDIDLLVEVPAAMTADEWVGRRRAFVARLYRSIGERRIDVLLAGVEGLAPPAPVLESARRQAVELVCT